MGEKLFPKTRIAVDLTPLLPGGSNGGAKPFTLALLKRMAERYSYFHFVFLTSDQNREELDLLFGKLENVEVLYILHDGLPAQTGLVGKSREIFVRIKERIKDFLRMALAPRIKKRLKQWYYEKKQSPKNSNLLQSLNVDLVFCPFTAPLYYDAHIPVISVIYDLQYQKYPEFFEPEDYLQRSATFRKACRLSDRLVTISEYTRQAILSADNVDPKHVMTIWISITDEISYLQENQDNNAGTFKYGFEKGKYLIYPANFWAHKNHAMLLTAFGIVLSKHQDFDWKLVLTGTPGIDADRVVEAAHRMGLEQKVFFLGFVPKENLKQLLMSSAALIFPSLFEGFGIPLVEAMRVGVPVLSSNVTSLPEVGGEAVLYFDPRKPDEMAEVIYSLFCDPELRNTLSIRGVERSRIFRDTDYMAQEYYDLFLEVMQPSEHHYPLKVEGVHSDGWTGSRVDIFFPAPDGSQMIRNVEIHLFAPPWLKNAVSVKASQGKNTIRQESVKPGSSLKWVFTLSEYSSYLSFEMTPTFRPDLEGLGEDQRELALMCTHCQFIAGDQKLNLLQLGDIP